MFVVNKDDLSIYATRGDIVFFSVTAEDDGKAYTFKAGDVVRIKVYGKKKAEEVVLQKDFPITADTDKVEIYLDREDTKIGEVISKPKDYWYSVTLNDDTVPQTIIGYDDDGAKLFRLFPEGADVPPYEPIKPEDIPIVDSELDLTSTRPVENQAVSRAIVSLQADFEETKEEVNEKAANTDEKVADVAANLSVERARIDNFVAGATAGDEELVDIRVGADGTIYASAGTAVREQFAKINDAIKVKCGKNLYNPSDDCEGYLKTDGAIAVYSDWVTTGYIDVSGLESIVASNAVANSDKRQPYNLMFLCTYGADKTLIEQVYDTGTDTYTIGENVKYVRFSYHRDEVENLQVESGTNRTAYEDYCEVQEFTNNKSYATNGDVAEGFGNIENAFRADITAKEITEAENIETAFEHPYVLSGSADDTFGKQLLIESGNVVFKVSDKIEIEPFSAYMICASAGYGHLLYAIYDKNDNIVKYEIDTTINGVGTVLQDKVIIAPYRASYIRISQYDTANANSKIALIKETKAINETVQKEKPYTGKKWVCMGDSLTEKNLRSTLNYHDYIAENTGITVVNMGRSGTGYKRTEDEGHAFYQRITNVPVDADVVTIFGSGNDLRFADVLGTPTDSGTETICGCINTTIDNLYAILPTIRLGIISPTPWIYNQPSDNSTMCRYADALKEICAFRGIPFLDLFRCSGLRPNDKTFRELAYSKDEGNGVHPDETGHSLIAPRIKAFLDSLIM